MKFHFFLVSSLLLLFARTSLAQVKKETKAFPALGFSGVESKNITPSDESAQVIVESNTGAKLSIGGFVRYDLIYDTIRSGSDAFFVTSYVPVEYDGIYYIDDRAITESTNYFSANAAVTQLRLIMTPPPKWGDDTKALIEGDFTAPGNTFRLRHAYGENKMFLFGQTWTNMMDIRDFPAVLEWQGPGVLPAHRNAQADIKFYQNDDYHTTFGIEQSLLATPLENLINSEDNRTISYEAVNNSLPAFVLSERGEGDWGHFHFGVAYNSVTLRDFTTNIPGDAQIIGKDYAIHAWAVNASGTIHMPRGQLLQYYATYDQGLTGYTADLNGSLEYILSVNKDGSVELVPSYGWVLAYKIPWNNKFFTQLSTSMLTVDWSRFDSPSEIANGNADIENNLDKKMTKEEYVSNALSNRFPDFHKKLLKEHKMLGVEMEIL